MSPLLDYTQQHQNKWCRHLKGLSRFRIPISFLNHQPNYKPTRRLAIFFFDSNSSYRTERLMVVILNTVQYRLAVKMSFQSLKTQLIPGNISQSACVYIYIELLTGLLNVKEENIHIQ